MIFIYRSCTGEFFYTRKRLSHDEEYCCICDDYDDYIGGVGNKKDTFKLLCVDFDYKKDNRIVKFVNSIEFA